MCSTLFRNVTKCTLDTPQSYCVHQASQQNIFSSKSLDLKSCARVDPHKIHRLNIHARHQDHHNIKVGESKNCCVVATIRGQLFVLRFSNEPHGLHQCNCVLQSAFDYIARRRVLHISRKKEPPNHTYTS
jgi:hypothetical protein